MRIWDITDGSSRTLAIADSVNTEVKSVAISPDGRLVATGGLDEVRDLYSFVEMYSEYSSYR